MEDTHPNIETIYRQMLKQKTGEERVKMGFSLLRFCLKLLLSSIGSKNAREVKKELFLRLYKDDFSKREREKIMAILTDGDYSSTGKTER